MALALLTRNGAKLQAFHKVLGNCNFSQLTSQPQVLSKLPLGARNIYVTPVLKSAHGNHSSLWNVERAVNIVLLGVVPLTIASPCGLFDNLAAVSLVAHQHWGLEACIIDYVRPIIFGNAIPKLAMGALNVLSFLVLGGLLYFNYNDVGIGKAIHKLWGVKAQ